MSAVGAKLPCWPTTMRSVPSGSQPQGHAADGAGARCAGGDNALPDRLDSLAQRQFQQHRAARHSGLSEVDEKGAHVPIWRRNAPRTSVRLL